MALIRDAAANVKKAAELEEHWLKHCHVGVNGITTAEYKGLMVVLRRDTETQLRILGTLLRAEGKL